MAETTTTETKSAKPELKKVTNVWAIYTDGDNGFAELKRPQDWGDPKWMYRKYIFTAEKLGYESHVHCWLDHQVREHEHAETFASLIVQILLPGTPENLCTNQFMDDEDFWHKSWGEMPPFRPDDPNDEDYGLDSDVS